jgi:preprotein translocase subunit SecE
VNNWIQIAIVAAVVGAAFAYLWKQGQIARLSVYVQETREELKKCSWPTWIELRGSTVLIIVTVALLSLFVVAVDYGLIKISAAPMLEILLVAVVAVVIAVKSKPQ